MSFLCVLLVNAKVLHTDKLGFGDIKRMDLCKQLLIFLLLVQSEVMPRSHYQTAVQVINKYQ